MKFYDILIIGGGASGFAAAITAKRNNSKKTVAIVEKKDRPGRKVAAAGNGRCNLSNMDCANLSEVLEFLVSVGITIRREDDGRLYPYSEDGGQVVRALKDEAVSLGVDIITDTAVTDVMKLSDGRFEVRPGFIAKKVLIATGGKSYANFGTTGDGYVIARKLGHRITPLIPGLTGIEVKENLRMLKGVRAKGKAALYSDGELIKAEEGEIQFREDAISGILIMNLSMEVRRGHDYKLVLNLAPDFNDVKFEKLMTSRTLLKDGILEYIKKTGEDPRKITFNVNGLKGWSEAQITCGGVELDDVNMLTMESRVVPGIYFAGEVLDIQGQCGGYNLHNAWFTGMRAGEEMAKAL